MDLVLRYLETAVRLARLAALETNPRVRADLEKQAADYRDMAQKRAKERNLPLPTDPDPA